MGRKPRDVTEAELSVLRVLWDRGSCSVREITDELYPEGNNSDFATVQKLCERLEAKRVVRADRRRRPYRFVARMDRDSLMERKLKAVAEELCAGSLSPLVSNLLRGGRFSSEELRELRQAVEQLQRNQGKADA